MNNSKNVNKESIHNYVGIMETCSAESTRSKSDCYFSELKDGLCIYGGFGFCGGGCKNKDALLDAYRRDYVSGNTKHNWIY